MPEPLLITSHSEADTHALGLRLACSLPDGIVVALQRPARRARRGSCKRSHRRGIDPRDVVSPTYTLVQEYRGAETDFHFDAYRLVDDDEFINLGPEEYFAAGGVMHYRVGR